MKSALSILAATFLVTVVVYPSVRPSALATAKADANTLRQLEADFMKAAADRGSQGYMSFYAEDAAELPNGEDMLQGKDNIAKTMGFLDRQEQPPDLDSGSRRHGRLGRLGLHIRNLRISL